MASFVAPIISGIGSLFGGIFGSHAATKAAGVQSDAAQKAQQLIAGNQNQATDFTKGVWNTEQGNINPYITAGQTDLSRLQSILPSVTTPYQSFQAPTGVDFTNDPGYKARYQMGLDQLTNSAAARGGLLSGGTEKAFENYAQDYASNEYGNVYNRALQGYQTNAQNYYTGQGNTFNRLDALAQMGLSGAGTLGAEGTAASGQLANTLLTGGAEQAQQINNAAAARASGIVGSANAWEGAFGGAANTASGAATLQQLQAIMAQSRGSGYTPNPWSEQIPT